MNTIAAAWDAFMRVLEEARGLQERGASANELWSCCAMRASCSTSIEAESAEQSIPIPSDARAVLAQLRGRRLNPDKALTPINPAGLLPA